jgi:MFS family permease
MGLDDPGFRIGILLEHAAWIGAPLLGLAWLDTALRSRRAAFGAAALAALGGAALAALPSGTWVDAATPLPLFLLLLGGWLLLQRRRTPRADPQPWLRLALVVFALAMLFKILLATRVQQYGFALTMPAAAVMVAACASWIPDRLRARGGSGWVLTAGALGAVLGAAFAYGRMSQEHYAQKVYAMGSAADRFYADWRGQFFKAALAYCRDRLPPDAEVLVLPEGVMINYLLKRRTPTPFVNFMPPEMALFGEEQMLSALQARPPAAVLLVHKPTAEYGAEFEFFGSRDYGDDIMSWVRANYQGTQLFGEVPLRRETRFGIAVFERKP